MPVDNILLHLSATLQFLRNLFVYVIPALLLSGIHNPDSDSHESAYLQFRRFYPYPDQKLRSEQNNCPDRL